MVSYSCGGGGYGPPVERDVGKVAHDVREKWISVDVAKQTYGVVVSSGGVIDQAATDKLRAGQVA